MLNFSGNIRVYCRVRPFLTKDPTRQTTIDYVGENGELVLANPSKPVGKDSRRSFTFNRCFDTKSLQGNLQFCGSAILQLYLRQSTLK
jgi:kinesin family protein C2/C3